MLAVDAKTPCVYGAALDKYGKQYQLAIHNYVSPWYSSRKGLKEYGMNQSSRLKYYNWRIYQSAILGKFVFFWLLCEGIVV